MILASDVVADILFTAHSLNPRQSLDYDYQLCDPELDAWKIAEASQRIQSALTSAKAPIKTAPRYRIPDTSIRLRRTDKRWRRLQVRMESLLPQSDPAILHYKKIWKKMRRQSELASDSAQNLHLDEWLRVEDEIFSYLQLALLAKRKAAKVVLKTEESNLRAYPAERMGYYNHVLQVQRSMDAFKDSLGEDFLKQWDSIWSAYWTFWHQSLPDQDDSGPLTLPETLTT